LHVLEIPAGIDGILFKINGEGYAMSGPEKFRGKIEVAKVSAMTVPGGIPEFNDPKKVRGTAGGLHPAFILPRTSLAANKAMTESRMAETRHRQVP
jgi:hypothetical protein